MRLASRLRSAHPSLGAEALLSGLVVLCPLALGGAAGWLPWPLVALSGLAAGLASLSAWKRQQRLHLPLLAWVLATSAALCLLQLLPLPPALLARLSPHAAELREAILLPLGIAGPRPLSLEPPATWRALALALAALLVFASAVQVSRTPSARERLLAVLAATGAGLAATGLVHALLGLQALWGFFSFTHARPPLLTPFGNPNHLAAWLGLSSTVAVGLALSTRSRGRAAAWALAAVLSGTGVVLSLSRGGIAAFAFSQGLLVLLLRRQSRSRGPLLAVVACLLAAAVAGGLVALEPLAAEWASTRDIQAASRSKVAPWPEVASAARAYPLGMGRGAFELAFPRYQARVEPNTLTHPENALLQLWAELGLPGLVLLVGMLVAFLRLLAQPRREPYELAVLAGVAGLGLHDCFDFSLEFPASAVAALVALATVARPREREPSRAQPAQGLSPVWGLGTAMALTALGLGALIPGRHTAAQAEQELQALVEAGAPMEEVRARAVALVERHPADHALQDWLGVAWAAQGRSGAGEALAAANRALFLRPVDAVAHRVAARALLSVERRTQAFGEYRLAQEAGDSQALEEALARARTLEELAALTPDSVQSAQEIAVALVLRYGGPERALGYLEWAGERFGEVQGVERLWEQLARLRLGRGEAEAAQAALAELERRAPEALPTGVLRAELMWARGKREAALQTLAEQVARNPGEVELAFVLARYQVEAGRTRQALETLERVAPELSGPEQRARALALEASAHEREGYRLRGLEVWQRVVRLAPEPNAWLEVARLHEVLQQTDEARQAVGEALKLLPPEATEARKQAEAWATRLEATLSQRAEQWRQQQQERMEGQGSELAPEEEQAEQEP
jgi:O-antigen ligase/tetratricopeptide (TPR) repeat protein